MTAQPPGQGRDVPRERLRSPIPGVRDRRSGRRPDVPAERLYRGPGSDRRATPRNLTGRLRLRNTFAPSLTRFSLVPHDNVNYTGSVAIELLCDATANDVTRSQYDGRPCARSTK